MFEIENLMPAAIAPFVLGHALVVVHNLDQQRPHHRADPEARLHRSRVPICLHAHTTAAIDHERIQHVVQRKALRRQGQ